METYIVTVDGTAYEVTVQKRSTAAAGMHTAGSTRNTR